ncbi:MAG TPA: PQQ-dependent sugar dehydrogenase, partial [Bryobacteraceae bacterium]|nr:PQQ-dependent sugar dehydrogenase [Bryobacteraceae bacterium]
MFVVEQRGVIRIVKNGSLLEQPFLDWRSQVSCCGEQGLLGLAFSPSFDSNRTFYINYTDPSGDTVISRMRVSEANPDLADRGSEQVVLRVDQPFSNHNGGNLMFGPEGYLYIGLGDGGSGGDPQNNGQRNEVLLGKMLRINVEGGQATYTTPADNPFINSSGGTRPEIWATGLRNPWKYSFDRETKDLWIADVGQNRAEEVNFQPGSSRGGENYGWRRMEGLECFQPTSGCDRTGLTLPVLEYPRSQGQSVTGGYVYRGSSFPGLRGFYVYSDFGSGNLWGLQRDGSNWDNRLLLATNRSVSTFGEDATGELYFASYGAGEIYRVVAGPPVISASGVVNAASFSAGISPGSLATVFGQAITSLPGIVNPGVFPIGTDVAGTVVTLNGVRAPILAVASVNGQEQINFQVPYELAGASSVSLAVLANGQSTAITVPVVNAQPEIFLVTRSGQNNATIWATGLGAVTNAPATGRPAPVSPLAELVSQPVVTVGGSTAPVSFAGLAPNFAGL